MSSVDRQHRYWRAVERRAKQINADGCSLVRFLYWKRRAPARLCCLQHDVEYHDGATVEGDPVTRRQADQRLRRCVQEWSWLRRASPLAVIRWLGVRIGGWRRWRRALQARGDQKPRKRRVLS